LQKKSQALSARTSRKTLQLRENSEVKKHSGLVINMDITIQQEKYQRAELEDWGKNK
jgi:hypothetical protein